MRWVEIGAGILAIWLAVAVVTTAIVVRWLRRARTWTVDPTLVHHPSPTPIPGIAGDAPAVGRQVARG